MVTQQRHLSHDKGRVETPVAEVVSQFVAKTGEHVLLLVWLF